MIPDVFLLKDVGHICRLKFRQLLEVTMLREDFLSSICIQWGDSRAQVVVQNRNNLASLRCFLVLPLFCSQPDFHSQGEGAKGLG